MTRGAIRSFHASNCAQFALLSDQAHLVFDGSGSSGTDTGSSTHSTSHAGRVRDPNQKCVVQGLYRWKPLTHAVAQVGGDQASGETAGTHFASNFPTMSISDLNEEGGIGAIAGRAGIVRIS